MYKEKMFCKHAHDDINIFLGGKEDAAVVNAASHLADDLECVLGSKIIWTKDPIQADIVIRTVPDELINKEEYHLYVSDGILYIKGADRRGSIYGIYEFSRMIGVSPWYYFGDVPRKRRESIELHDGFSKRDVPGIPYRGIFINDEEELENWAKAGGKESTIGPYTYEKIFELLLRLRGNILWPAMHVSAFNHNPENARLADSMGIIIGTSHCDIMMRNNYCEWDKWVKDKGYDDLRYDYSIKGTNRQRIREYWDESVRDNKDYEVCYTVGMRGIHDSEFETSKIDELHLSEKEALDKKKELLEKIISDQQKILEGQGVSSDVMQIFVPYKEVLTIYDAGLKVPDNVTLMWVDDNFGYMRRYPDEKERFRKGGNGLYYHGSYWGHPNMSYLFLNSIPLSHTLFELEKAYEQGIRKIWICNLGCIKPLEQDVDFFLNTAWNIGKISYKSDVRGYLKDFYNETFTGKIGETVSDILIKWSQITNMCKLEHMHRDAFVQEGLFDEAAFRVNMLKELTDEAYKLMKGLQDDEKDSFFEFVVFKLEASLYINSIFYYSDRSRLCMKQGKYSACDLYTDKVRSISKMMHELIDRYNTKISDGKWNKIITPFDYPPPTLPKIYDCMPAAPLFETDKMSKKSISYSKKSEVEKGLPPLPRIKVIDNCENDIIRLECMPGECYGSYVKCFEIYPSKYRMAEEYRIEHSTGVGVSKTEGVVDTEVRIGVWKADNYTKNGYVRIYDKDDNLVRDYTVICDSVCDRGYLETQDFQDTKDIQDTQDIQDTKDIQDIKDNKARNVVFGSGDVVIIEAGDIKAPGWHIIPFLGRGYGDLICFDDKKSLDFPEKHAFQNEIIMFEISQKGEYMIDIHRFPSLDSNGNIYITVYVDDEPMTFISDANDEWRGSWKNNVINDVDCLSLKVKFERSGVHTIRLGDTSVFFAFSRIVIRQQHIPSLSLELEGLVRRTDIGKRYWDIPDIKNYDDQKIYGQKRETQNRDDQNSDDHNSNDQNRDDQNSNDQNSKDQFDLAKYKQGILECDLSSGNVISMLKFSYDLIDLVHSPAVNISKKEYRERFETPLHKSEMIQIDAFDVIKKSEYSLEDPDKVKFKYGISGETFDDLYIYTVNTCNNLSQIDDYGHINFKIRINTPGKYTIAILANIYDGISMPVKVSVDGSVIPIDRMSGNGRLWTFDGLSKFQHIELTKVYLNDSEHDLSLALKSCVRIKRILVYI